MRPGYNIQGSTVLVFYIVYVHKTILPVCGNYSISGNLNIYIKNVMAFNYSDEHFVYYYTA